MIPRLLVLASVALLGACSDPPPVEDPKVVGERAYMRIHRFERCMELVPPPPPSAKYSDWDEVIAECDDVARRHSRLVVPCQPDVPMC